MDKSGGFHEDGDGILPHIVLRARCERVKEPGGNQRGIEACESGRDLEPGGLQTRSSRQDRRPSRSADPGSARSARAKEKQR